MRGDRKALTVEIGLEEYLKLQDLRVESLRKGRFVSVSRVMRDAIKHYLQEVDLRDKYLNQADKDTRGGNHNHPPHKSNLNITGDHPRGGDTTTNGGDMHGSPSKR